jgi:uncharacterized protein
MKHQLTIAVFRQNYAICRLEAKAAVPEWAARGNFLSVSRTPSELSVVCEESLVPAEVHAERNRSLMQIEGTLAFSLTGVLASVAAPLAEAGISIFAVSTYDTDYFLVSRNDLAQAVQVLEKAGHSIRESP